MPHRFDVLIPAGSCQEDIVNGEVETEAGISYHTHCMRVVHQVAPGHVL